MPRTGYGKMHKGGGMFDSLSKKATQLKNDAIKKSKDMGLHDKAADAHKAAMSNVTAAKQMVSDASNQAMTKGMEVHGKMKPHLNLAAGHANEALMHAQNKNVKGFNDSMGNFASAMGNAGAAGNAELRNNTTLSNASLEDHANAMSDKVSTMSKDTVSDAMKFLGLGSKPDAPAAASAPAPAAAPAPAVAPAPAMGGRRRKSRKHSKKVQKSRTMKGRKGHRMTKNKGMKKRSYKTRKGSKPKKMLKSRTKK